MQTEASIREILNTIDVKGWSPELVTGLQVKDGQVLVAMEVDPALAKGLEPLRSAVEDHLSSLEGVAKAQVIMTAEAKPGTKTPPQPASKQAASQTGKAQAQTQTQPQTSQQQGSPIPGVKHVIAVGSGKGGVGKSTTAVNLALALQAQGKAVGILDADIYGPSLPKLLGLTGKPQSSDNVNLDAMEAFGLKAMSMGLMVEEDTAMIWRGPMIQSAVRQMLHQVVWGPLDVLVVDLPPGTGDAQLSLAQQVPLSGAVVVSTPQDLALLDAKKAVSMFRKLEVPIFGLIENMSTFECPNCQHESHIFGHGGAEREAKKLSLPFLGALPLVMDLRETSDAGTPLVARQPDSKLAATYRDMATEIIKQLDGTGAKSWFKFPSFGRS